jgi:lipopolysaccharide/colanic/teichoic acid biosynthesis glycosyltransferase
MDTIDAHHREAQLPASAERLRPARRILDIAFATALLVLLLPLLALLALLVRVASGAPVLFRQPRVGAGGREFTLLKFRSMRLDNAGPEVTCDSDLRVTGLGRLLRRLSLDELPQLWNVLRGDMTLAGPRPEVPHLAERYPSECRWVFRYRPGLTGPCQLRSRDYAEQLDGRSDPEEYYLKVLVARRVELDAEFLRHATVPRVLHLTFQTLCYVLTSIGERHRHHDRSGSGSRRAEGGGR